MKNCPSCGSIRFKKFGHKNGLQRFRCHDCKHVWQNVRSARPRWVSKAYYDYSSGKQRLRELSVRYSKSVSTLQRHFDRYFPTISSAFLPCYPVALTFDATFFGRGYGLLVYRAEGRNIYWQEIVSETLAVVEQGLVHLQAEGWRFSSVTIDGRPGVIALLKHLFSGTPIQLCLYHQAAIVRRYTTSKPKTDWGKAIKILMGSISQHNEASFRAALEEITITYRNFLKERNENHQFMHRRLRSALRSLRTNLPYLFTHKNYPDLVVPTTTNSCDGSFAHWKAKVKIHRGLRKQRRTKMINSLLAIQQK